MSIRVWKMDQIISAHDALPREKPQAEFLGVHLPNHIAHQVKILHAHIHGVGHEIGQLDFRQDFDFLRNRHLPRFQFRSQRHAAGFFVPFINFFILAYDPAHLVEIAQRQVTTYHEIGGSAVFMDRSGFVQVHVYFHNFLPVSAYGMDELHLNAIHILPYYENFCVIDL